MKKVLFAITLIAGFSVAHAADDKLSREQVSKMLKPVGQVHVGTDASADAGPREPRSGEEVVNTKCGMCHNAGVSGAPKSHDVAAWQERLAKGFDVVLSNAINGINAMPPKGTCSDCTDDEIKAAIEFMSK